MLISLLLAEDGLAAGRAARQLDEFALGLVVGLVVVVEPVEDKLVPLLLLFVV